MTRIEDGEMRARAREREIQQNYEGVDLDTN